MGQQQIKNKGVQILKKWWASITLLPLVLYSLHQAYRSLEHSILYAVSYDFPFPVNVIHISVDSFLLLIHESGHIFFSLFGWRPLTILGGSLLEILLPLVILRYFWLTGLKAGVQFSFYLLGFGFLRVAYYAADAAARKLPLLGNLTKESHDWHNLLIPWDAVGAGETIAFCLAIIAALLYMVALALPLYYQKYRPVNLDLEL